MDRKPYYGSEHRSSKPVAADRQRSAPRSSAPRRPSPADRPMDNHRPQGPQPNPQRQAPHRRRKKDPLARIIPIFLLLGIIAAIVYVGSCWFITTLNRSTFCSNVSVNGIDIDHCTREEGASYVREVITSRLITSYTLSWQDKSWTFSALDFNAHIDTDPLMERAWNLGHVGNIFDRSRSIRALKQNPINMEAPLVYDESLIDALVDNIYNALYIAPVDATVLVDLSQPILTGQSSQGQELDKETAREQIISLIETGEGASVLPVITLEPNLSTESAMNTLDIIVEYSTDTSARGYNSRFNVRKALTVFNGMEVKPGETVDFNAVVGPRTEATGWQKATEYVAGTTQEDYGGGICQASTTLYGAVLKAGMTIIERSPHSMTVAYVEPSLDAAVTNTGSKNLIFRNDTENSIFIYTEVTKEAATVTIRGRKPAYRYELNSTITSQDTAAVRVSYVADTEGKYCYYESDPPVLYKKGRAACTSDGYLIAYDWETGLEVSRTWLSHDMYDSGTDIYWKGIHSVGEINAGMPMNFNVIS